MTQKERREITATSAMFMYVAMASAERLPHQFHGSAASVQPEFKSVGNLYFKDGSLCNTCPVIDPRYKGKTARVSLERPLTNDDLKDLRKVRAGLVEVDERKSAFENLRDMFVSEVDKVQARERDFEEKKENVSVFQKIKSYVKDGRAPYSREVTITESIEEKAFTLLGNVSTPDVEKNIHDVARDMMFINDEVRTGGHPYRIADELVAQIETAAAIEIQQAEADGMDMGE